MTWAEGLSLSGREVRGSSRCGLVWRCLSGDSWAVWYGRFLFGLEDRFDPTSCSCHVLVLPMLLWPRMSAQAPRAQPGLAKNPPGARVEPVTSHRCSRIAGVVDAGSSVN
jgi:hypothetical protein